MTDGRGARDDAEAVGAAWIPPGLRFEVGDRVQIHLSAECQFEYTSGVKHHPNLDGAIGMVEDRPTRGADCQHTEHDPSHRYTVTFNPPVVVAQGHRYRHTVLSECFAAAELILLPAQPAATSGEGEEVG